MSFNGATAMKPWKSDSFVGEAIRVVCFNGATAMKPWKRPATWLSAWHT